jgi:hypothetical protein
LTFPLLLATAAITTTVLHKINGRQQIYETAGRRERESSGKLATDFTSIFL